MTYTAQTKLGQLLADPAAKALLDKHVPDLGPRAAGFAKAFTLGDPIMNRLLGEEGWLDDLLAELAELTPPAPAEDRAIYPVTDYEDSSVPAGSAAVLAPATATRWGLWELRLAGPSHGNPFTDVELTAEFSLAGRSVTVTGFYDGDGVHRVRFMPDATGEWSYRTSSNARSLDGITGGFTCEPAEPGVHGPVRVAGTFHFAHADGTRFVPIGTTCYAWTHQGDELEERTLATLANSPYTKVRMCVFPKAYMFNENEPPLYPFEGSPETGWDHTRFDPAFFRHLENRIADLARIGVEADLILFHPYDRWGFEEMPPSADDRYLRYVTARLAAHRNVWWSLANEFDFLWKKEDEDWERFGRIVAGSDPYGHLLSIHNGLRVYDQTRDWVTHCSVQATRPELAAEQTDRLRTRWNKPVVIDELGYEGDIWMTWGDLSAEELVRRCWEVAARGGYTSHGETYLNPDDILWWSKGGDLHGRSTPRLAFLRRLLEEAPGPGLTPVDRNWEFPAGAVDDAYSLVYLGVHQPRRRHFQLRPGLRVRVDVIDTWNMTVDERPGVHEGLLEVELPGRPWMAVRLRRVPEGG